VLLFERRVTFQAIFLKINEPEIIEMAHATEGFRKAARENTEDKQDRFL